MALTFDHNADPYSQKFFESWLQGQDPAAQSFLASKGPVTTAMLQGFMANPGGFLESQGVPAAAKTGVTPGTPGLGGYTPPGGTVTPGTPPTTVIPPGGGLPPTVALPPPGPQPGDGAAPGTPGIPTPAAPNPLMQSIFDLFKSGYNTPGSPVTGLFDFDSSGLLYFSDFNALSTRFGAGESPFAANPFATTPPAGGGGTPGAGGQPPFDLSTLFGSDEGRDLGLRLGKMEGK